MRTFLLLSFLSLIFTDVEVLAQNNRNVLIFTKTTGFRHANIAKGVSVVKSLLEEKGIKSIHSEDSNYFCSDSLDNFQAVIFLSTTGELFTESQKKAFQNFIRSGKGFVGIHAASNTESNWKWFNQLVGGVFLRHPEVQNAEIQVVDRTHQSTKHLQELWFHRDEWYDFRDVKPRINVLLNLNEGSYNGGTMGKFHPIAWFQDFEGGRSFYTALGHTDESFDSEKFQRHIIGGVLYALGDSN